MHVTGALQSCQLMFPNDSFSVGLTTLKCFTPCTVAVLLLISWASVFWCWADSPSSQCYTAERTEEKRARTCERSAQGGHGVCIVFSRWESQGWEWVCAFMCVYVHA